MARARDPNRDKAFEIYKEHNGEIQNREIAKLLDVDEKKVAVWKQRDKWNVVQQTKNNVVQQKKEKGAPIGNTNAKGNKGNKNASPPKRNSNAEKHGFYKRVLPEELMEMFEEVESKISEVDMLWDQIKLQYLAIMRSQSIMFVESKDEMIKELKKRKDSEWGEEIEYEFQFAWDRQATFLNAQSRAISELRNSIEQFNKLASETDKRKLQLEQMQLNIDKTKAEIANMSKNQGQSVTVIIEDDVYE